MTSSMSEREIVQGGLWQARNWSADARGSIHDDATASDLGFRGGTVAGSIHMDQFVPVLLDLYGPRWFESGNLSLYFANATVDGERVRVSAERPEGEEQIRVFMQRDDDLPICSGTAVLGDHSKSALRERDLRAVDPSELRILRELSPGLWLGDVERRVDGTRQLEKLEKGLLSDPIDWYRDDSPWGAPLAAPSTLVELLWGVPTEALRGKIGRAVGLFGAIEIGHVAGPLLLGRSYRVTAEIAALAQSPKTEILWFDSEARDQAGELIAKHRMMLRFMKASSPLYRDT